MPACMHRRQVQQTVCLRALLRSETQRQDRCGSMLHVDLHVHDMCTSCARSLLQGCQGLQSSTCCCHLAALLQLALPSSLSQQAWQVAVMLLLL